MRMMLCLIGEILDLWIGVVVGRPWPLASSSLDFALIAHDPCTVSIHLFHILPVLLGHWDRVYLANVL